jgi:hypothetical protein
MAAILESVQLNTGGFGVAEFLSAKEAANLLDVSKRAVTGWCEAGEIEGAEKINDGQTSAWVIPKDGFATFKAKREKMLKEKGKAKK